MRYYTSLFVLLAQLMLCANPGFVNAAMTHKRSVLTTAVLPVADYFALISVDTATPIAAGDMRADGGDIRFIDCDPAKYTEYNYWIESGLNTAATKIWIKIPLLQPYLGSFNMYYGDPAATHANGLTNVFPSGIVSLFTFTEASGTTVHDWAGGHDLTLSGGATWSAGPRADMGSVTGFTVPGRLAAADAGPALGAGDFSVFSLVYPNAGSLGGNANSIIGSIGAADGWALKLQGAPATFMLETKAEGDFCQSGLGALTASSWVMLGGRRISGTGATLFQAGNSVGDCCPGDTRNVTNAANIFEIGRYLNNQFPIDGKVALSIVFNRALSDIEAAALNNSIMPLYGAGCQLLPDPATYVTISTAADSYRTTIDELLSVEAPGVLANDTGTGLVANIVSSAAHGNVVLNADGSFIYVPDESFTGTDSFSYSATNGAEYNTPSAVTITVVADNETDNDTCSLTVTPIRRLLSFLMPLRVITLSVAAGTDFPMGEDISWGTYAIKTLRINQTSASNQIKALVMLRPFQLNAGEYDVRVGTCVGTLEVQ